MLSGIVTLVPTGALREFTALSRSPFLFPPVSSSVLVPPFHIDQKPSAATVASRSSTWTVYSHLSSPSLLVGTAGHVDHVHVPMSKLLRVTMYGTRLLLRQNPNPTRPQRAGVGVHGRTAHWPRRKRTCRCVTSRCGRSVTLGPYSSDPTILNNVVLT